LDFGFYAATGVGRAAFEEVDAFVHGSDKGYAGFGNGFGLFAEEGDDGGLAALGGLFGASVVVTAIFVIVFVAGAAEERS
jgi:hypothetical protein